MGRFMFFIMVLFVVFTLYYILQIYDSKHGKHSNEAYENALVDILTRFFRLRASDMEKELPYIFHFFTDEFGNHFALQLINKLKFQVYDKVNIRIQKIKLSHKLRLRILEFLIMTAKIEGIQERDLRFFETARLGLSISEHVYSKILAKHYTQSDNRFEQSNPFLSGYTQRLKLAYQTLGIPENSEASLIKKTFRELAKKYHPDTSQFTSTRQKQDAEAYFSVIKEAYEFIKISRNIK